MADIDISTPAESISVTDGGSTQLLGPLHVTESVTPFIASSASGVETLTVTEDVSRSMPLGDVAIPPGEPIIALDEEATGELTGLGTGTDSLTVTDVVTDALVAYAQSVADSLTVTEGGRIRTNGPIHITEDVAVAYGTQTSLSVSDAADDVTITEGGTLHRVGTIHVEEAITPLLSAPPGENIDSIGLSDDAVGSIASVKPVLPISRGDDIPIVEWLDFGGDAPIRVTDIPIAALAGGSRSTLVSDPVTTADVLVDVTQYDYALDTGVVFDPLALTDSTPLTLISDFDYDTSVFDPVAVTDEPSPHIPQYPHTQTATDPVTVTDDPTPVIRDVILRVLVPDPVGVLDVPTRRLDPDYVRTSVIDPVTLSDSAQGGFTMLNAAVSDPIGVLDVVTDQGLDQTFILTLIARRDTTFELTAKVPYKQGGASVWILDSSRLNVNTTLV